MYEVKFRVFKFNQITILEFRFLKIKVYSNIFILIFLFILYVDYYYLYETVLNFM